MTRDEKKNMKYIEIAEIIVHAKAGSIIWECQREAAKLALSEDQNIVLIHNSRRYIIIPSEIISVFREEKRRKNEYQANRSRP